MFIISLKNGDRFILDGVEYTKIYDNYPVSQSSLVEMDEDYSYAITNYENGYKLHRFPNSTIVKLIPNF